MSKTDQLKQQQKDIKAKTTPEKLQQIQQNQKDLLKKVNPLASVLDSLTATQKAMQATNSLAEFTKQQRILFDNLKLSQWQETFIMVNDILPKGDLFTTNKALEKLSIKPYFEYGRALQDITNKFTTSEIVKTYQSVRDLGNDIETAKTEAENNFWHNLTVEEYEFNKEKDKQQIEKLETEKSEMQNRLKELEITLANMVRLSNNTKPKQPKTEPKNLKPNITQSQIAKLYEALKEVFEATPEQWRALFSDTEIQLFKPIEAKAVSDIGVLLHYLKERNLIEAIKYPSIIERTKAFAINGIPITSKKINDLKANMNFPTIGKNYSKISKAVASC